MRSGVLRLKCVYNNKGIIMALRIKVRATGAYLVEGDLSELELVDHEGNPIPIPEGKKNIALCRCGASTNKPFCDSTHSKIGFLAAEQAVNQEKKVE